MEEDDILQALADLKLPHMPSKLDLDQALPSIQILVVSDISSSSAAALAEYVLQQQHKYQHGKQAAQNDKWNPSQIDLCIACGPFCRDQDVKSYLVGHANDRQQRLRHNNTGFSSKNGARYDHLPGATIETPFVRSKEESAGLEGLFTASLTQLEAVVCRLVYVPGVSDPLTIIQPSNPTPTTRQSKGPRRLTPNSRNVHKQWFPLAPHLGCAGLLYLDSTQVVLGHHHHHKSRSKSKTSKRPMVRRRRSADSSDDDEGGPENDMELLTEQLVESQKSSGGYLATLSKLLQLAPAIRQHNPLEFSTKNSQTILVTHYADLAERNTLNNKNSNNSTDDDDDDDDSITNSYEDDEPMNGSPSWAIDEEEAQRRREEQKEQRKQEKQKRQTERHKERQTEQAHCGPWPKGHHTFLDSQRTQQLLCLEIASGPHPQPPQVFQRGKVSVVLPGSLRTRGEFCLVTLTVQPATLSPYHASKTTTTPKKWEWGVSHVEFLNIYDKS